MPHSNPRFEFRAFAQSFGLVSDRIRAAAFCNEISESREIYLLADEVRGQNVKVREHRLEIKSLLERRDGLERWDPTTFESLPVSRDTVSGVLLPALGSPDVPLRQLQFSLAELLTEIVWPSPSLRRACVFKRRFKFEVNDCATELDEILINGAAISSVAVESESAGAVTETLTQLGLHVYENTSYPAAVRRVIGMEQLSNEESYGKGN